MFRDTCQRTRSAAARLSSICGALLLASLLALAPHQVFANKLVTGTIVKVTLITPVDSRDARVGDKVKAQVADDDTSGLPKDSVLVGRVTEVDRATSSSPGMLDFHFSEIYRENKLIPMQASLASADSSSATTNGDGQVIGKRNNNDSNKIIGVGAGAGALIGLSRKRKLGDAVRGGILGALAGAIYNQTQKKRQENHDVSLAQGFEFGVQLDKPLIVHTSIS